MKLKSHAAGIFLLLVVSLVVFDWPLRANPAGPQRAQVWEHRVVRFEGTDDSERLAEMFTDRVARLSHEGWEYVGPLCEYSFRAGQLDSSTQVTMYIAFRRPRD